MNNPIILIIEDNKLTRKMLRITLESTKNYTVLTAQNGAEGLAMAEKYKPNLILLDLFLGDMNGVDINKKLRAMPDIKDIPIIALSGFLTGLNEQKNNLDFTAFLLKPIQPSLLIEIIKTHLLLAKDLDSLSGEGHQILIADDNAIQLKLLGMQLKNAGFQITTADDGLIALDKAKEKPPDAIISDILMPNLDGFGLCLAVRKDPKLSAIPVILLSSHYLEEADVELAHKVGANRYLTRTPDEKILINVLTDCLKEKKISLLNINSTIDSDIKEQHTNRLIRQLEQQILSNSQLSQKLAIQTSEIFLLTSVAKTLTMTNKKIEDTLTDVLCYLLDAAGASQAALYINQVNGSITLQQFMGFKESQRKELETFFGQPQLLTECMMTQTPSVIPSQKMSKKETEEFLKRAKIQSGLIVPLNAGAVNHGVLFLGSSFTNLLGDHPLAFAHALGMQIGQSIALAEAFETLTTSEQQHRQLVETSPDAIFIQQDDKLAFVNAAGLKLLGEQKQKKILTQSILDFFQPADRQVMREYISGKDTTMELPFVEKKIARDDNKIIDVEVTASPFTYQNKPATYLIMRDISDSKQSKLHLEVQYAIAWTLAKSTTLQEATNEILKVICQRLSWDIGVIWVVDKKLNILRCVTIWQTPDITNDEFKKECLSLTLTPGQIFPGIAWKSRQAIWSSKFNNDYLRVDAAAEIGLNTAICFPIIYENEILGVIEFFNRKSETLSQNLLSWFESLGNQFGLFLNRKHMEGQMLYLAEHDVLTGLANRKLIEESLRSELEKAKKYHKKLAVLFLDLDQFKLINDSMGHQVGDILLIEIAKILLTCVRPQDIIGRVGGDEFIIVFPHIYSNKDVVQIAQRIQKKLENKFLLKEKEFFTTASMGISLYPEDGDSVESLIKDADIAMYHAKEMGRNNFQFCTKDMTSKAGNRVMLQNSLHNALENNEFILYYQPKIDLKTRKTIGMEALIRWKRFNKVILPEKFIDAVEESDLIKPLTEWVLKTACIQNKEWQAKGLPSISVAINFSINNLNEHILETVENVLKTTGLHPHHLEIELTERILMKSVENNIHVLKSLKNLGVKISIDDFGTGYSSLSYLKRFPIDYLKIDKSFIQDITTNPDDSAIVVAIIVMAHSLGFKVIAEGVETKEQLTFLSKHGVDEVQGYYFSRPLSAKEAALFIQKGTIL
ncbi:MAG: EAL domain-containing protein [Alphaproteobacteria bacterium]|nr:EAL domain-containing protein [Alphaproteobacteria bacterium]